MKLMFLALVAVVIAAAVGWDFVRQHDGARVLVAMGLSDAQQAAIAPYVQEGRRHTVVHFWATWCPPCMVEMPHLLEVLPTLPDDVVLVMVSLDSPPPADFYAQNKIADTAQVRWIDDPSRTLTGTMIPRVKLPTTLIFRPSPTTLVQQIDGPLLWPPLLKVLEDAK